MQSTDAGRLRRLLRRGLTAIALSLGIVTAAGAASYPEPLLPPDHFPDSKAFGINNNSEVTGSVGDYDYGVLEREIGGVWDDKGRIIRTLEPLPLASHPHARGQDINDSGVVAGISGEFYGVFDAVPVLWDAAGNVTALPLLPGHKYGDASAINDVGQVVGHSTDGNSASRMPVVWDGNGEVRVLPDGDLGSWTNDINNNGEIVGSNSTGAIKWTADGTASNLPPAPGYVRADAVSINDRGIAVGTSTDSSGVRRATKWKRNGKIKILRPLRGDDSSTAVSINGKGLVLGTSTRGSSRDTVTTIVTWDRSGKPTPHRSFKTFDGAFVRQINDKGEFVGTSNRVDDFNLDKYTSMGTIWY